MLTDLQQNNRPRVGLGTLIFNAKNEVLLGKRKSSLGISCWGPPGGHLEFGESLEACAIRETLEETGLIIHDPRFLSITNDVFEKENKHYISIFMRAYLQTDQTVKHMEPDKVESWHWFSLKHLPEDLFLPLKQLILGVSYGTFGTLNFYEALIKEEELS